MERSCATVGLGERQLSFGGGQMIPSPLQN